MRAYLDDLLATPESVKYVNCLTVLSRCQKLFEIVPGLDFAPHPRLPPISLDLGDEGTNGSAAVQGQVTMASSSGSTEPAPAENAPKADSPLILIPKNTSKFVNPKWTMVAIGLFGAILVPNLVKEYREAVVKFARDMIPDNPSKELQYLLTSPVMPREPPTKEDLQGNDFFSYQRYFPPFYTVILFLLFLSLVFRCLGC